MSTRSRFTISFKATQRDRAIFKAIQGIEEQERSQKIKDILYKELILKGENENE